MKNLVLLLFVASFVFPPPAFASTPSPLDLLLVVGPAGEKEYSTVFQEEVQDWIACSRSANKTFRVLDSRVSELE